MSEADRRGRKPISERAKTIATEFAGVAEEVGVTVRETVRETRGTVEDALSARKKVVMVRLNDTSVERLDDLVEAGIAGSRSEAAAYLIGEGVEANRALFDRIAAKVAEIRKAKKDLKELMKDQPPEE